MDLPNHMLDAQRDAVARARGILQTRTTVDVARRTGATIAANGGVDISLLGRDMHVAPATRLVTARGGQSVSLTEELLVLRYLSAERELTTSGELIALRELPGGAAYLQPMLARTTSIILSRFGNDKDLLLSAIRCYPHKPVAMGDVGASVHAIGKIDITLIYRCGDKEFPPSCDLLLPREIVNIYHTDEAVALALLLCKGLAKAADLPRKGA